MVDPLIVAVLAFFHILFAMLWLGGSFIFAAVLGPLVQSLPPSAQREFTMRTFSVNRYFRMVAGLTVLSGFLLLYVFINGDFSILMTTAWGQRIAIGMTLGFAAFLNANFYTAPHMDRAASILRQMKEDETRPPEEFLRMTKVGIISATVTLALILVTLLFMVGAGFY